MKGNPFQGTEFEGDWANGFNAGMVAPNADISAPLPLILEAQEAFNQGVATGQSINRVLELPAPAAEATSFEEFVEAAEAIAHFNEPRLELKIVWDDVVVAWKAAEAVEAGTGAAAVRQVVLSAGFVVAFEVAVVIAIWGPRRDAFFSGTVSDRLEQIVGQISSEGSGSNLELFMAVCFLPDHSFAVSDVLSDTGCWHGLFRLDFASAVEDAREHEHVENVRVLRFQTSTPGIVEVLGID